VGCEARKIPADAEVFFLTSTFIEPTRNQSVPTAAKSLSVLLFQAMSAHLVVGIVAFVCGVACAIASSLVCSEMVDRVNDKLPEESQFSRLWWYWSKYQRLYAEYKRLYPDGDPLRAIRLLQVLGFASFVVLAWGLGLFSR
jgi:hypothetical protein